MPKHEEVKMPDLLNYWTVDEVAECIDGIGTDIHQALWSFITPATDGDDAPLAKVVWPTLTREQQERLAAAVNKEHPE